MCQRLSKSDKSIRIQSMTRLFVLFLSIAGTVFANTKVPSITRKTPSCTSKASCHEIFQSQEEEKGLPQGLLQAISKVESNYSAYAINAKGRAYHFNSKEEAADFIRSLKNEGVRNINIGYMQLNYASHRSNFSSEEHMLDPQANIAYAAKLLKRLSSRHGVEGAVKLYHSPHAHHHEPYKNKVYAHWAQLKRKNNSSAAAVKKAAAKKVEPVAKKEVPLKNQQARAENNAHPLSLKSASIGWATTEQPSSLSGYLSSITP
jgi:soluble lytic murein transglycosylase-like protein